MQINTQEASLIIIINVKNSCAQYFFPNFFQYSLIESSKEQYLFEIEIFCNIINVFILHLLINLYASLLKNK